MANKQLKTANGNPNILTEDQEHMRLQVVDLELKARYWEAQWKIRFYTLEAEKMQPEYNEWLEKEKAKQEEAFKRFQEELENMTKKAEADKVATENKDFLDSLAKDSVSPLTIV